MLLHHPEAAKQCARRSSLISTLDTITLNAGRNAMELAIAPCGTTSLFDHPYHGFVFFLAYCSALFRLRHALRPADAECIHCQNGIHKECCGWLL
jgi:hypothetical protein